MLQFLYDHATYLTDEEYQNKFHEAPITNIQKFVERPIIYIILSVKAKNVKEFSALLLSNKEKMFAEATRHPIWGIGLSFSDKEKEKVAKWSGLNIMGHLIKEIIEQK